MAKRRVVDDDDDQSAPTYVSKRARTQSNSAHASSSRDDEVTMVDDVEVEEVAESSDAGEPNGAPAATEEDQEAEEKKFEQEHGDKIRQSLDAKRNHQGVCLATKSDKQLITACSGYRGPRNFRVHRDESFHVSQMAQIQLWPSNQFYHR